jgi:acyl-CoA-binding protein
MSLNSASPDLQTSTPDIASLQPQQLDLLSIVERSNISEQDKALLNALFNNAGYSAGEKSGLINLVRSATFNLVNDLARVSDDHLQHVELVNRLKSEVGQRALDMFEIDIFAGYSTNEQPLEIYSN